MARILVIDDEATIRSEIHKTLQMAGYEVDVAPDGEAGVKNYRNRPADLVVTDIRMPKKDGLEVINGGDAEVIDWEAYGRWMGPPVRRMR